MPLYTLRNKLDPTLVRDTTDPGIAASLMDVVKHYEAALGFVYTQQEREDLVAVMEAL